jgi:hypothetical protein
MGLDDSSPEGETEAGALLARIELRKGLEDAPMEAADGDERS